MESARLFRRVETGHVGIGFVQKRSGVDDLAVVAWPAGEPKKYQYRDLAGYGVEELVGNELDLEEYLKVDGQSARGIWIDEEIDEETKQKVEDALSETAIQSGEIEAYLHTHGLDVTNKQVIAGLKEHGVTVTSPQVTEVKERLKAED